MIEYQRILDMRLPSRQSAFLWGARKTGKSTYLKSTFPKSIRYDLLKSDQRLRLAKAPYLLREEVLALPKSVLLDPIIIDEVQKVPSLLDEVHWLIENTTAQFILCGSSARKLKRGAANLLGGRAWRYTFYPLTYPEITDFDLLKALNRGLIPGHYLASNPRRSLTAYIENYLIEEIQAEGLVRELPSFARFLDVIGIDHGGLVNFSNISRECGIDSKTVQNYYQILVDTLLGYFIYPYAKKSKRALIQNMPKFYLFDTGVANTLSHAFFETLSGTLAGKAFEHFILMELIAYRGLKHLDFKISFWRTKTGLEVDFVLEDAQMAIEVKISQRVDKTELKGICAFQEEYPKARCIVVSADTRARVLQTSYGRLEIFPWKVFLEKLWTGSIVK